jgi:GntR family transcriptional regulator
MHKPLHITVTDNLRSMIFSSEYSTGDKLPTEPELAHRLGVSRATLREAFKQLESEGVIHRLHGVGTFIRTQSQGISLTLAISRSVTTMIESLGFVPGTSAMKVNTESVFPDDVDRLKLNPGSTIVRIERIRTANSQPVAYTIDIVPSWVMKQLPQWDNKSNFSLIEHLTYRCGTIISESNSTLIPLHNIHSVAEKLDIDPSSHIFFLEGVAGDKTGLPIIFSREYFTPWIFRFSVTRKP